MKIEDYKGHEIFLDRGEFDAIKDGQHVCSDEKLSALKKWIDEAEKKRVRCSVIFNPGFGGDSPFVEGTITSITLEKTSYGSNIYDAWVSWKEGGKSRREKSGLSSLIKPTPYNRRLVFELNALLKTKEETDDKITKLTGKLEKFKLKDFGYEE